MNHDLEADAAHDTIVRRIDIAGDHPAFAGHFPGRPLLPGVALVAEVLEAALAEPSLAARIVSAPRLDVVKFLAPVLPGASLVIRLHGRTGGFEFVVEDGARVVASGRFSNATPRSAA